MTAPATDLTNAPIFPDAKPASGAPEYEFREAENAVFTALARGMRFVGAAQGITGVALFVIAAANVWMGGPPALVSSVPMALTGAMFAMTGVWLRRASEPVARIVSTKGSDIRNLMEAMAGLAQMFALQRVYFLVVAALSGLAVVGAVVALSFFADFMHRWL